MNMKIKEMQYTHDTQLAEKNSKIKLLEENLSKKDDFRRLSLDNKE